MAAAANPLAAALAGVGAADDPATVRLQQLQQQQADLVRQKRETAKAIRLETRKKDRLKQKARQLSTAELQEVLVARVAAEAAAAAKGKGKGKGKAAPVAPLAAAPAAAAPLAAPAAGADA